MLKDKLYFYLFCIVLFPFSLLFAPNVNAVTPVTNEIQKVLGTDGTSADQFGFSISIDGDRAIVGARHDSDNGFESGSAYIYKFDSTTNSWMEEQKLLASDGASGDEFGDSVSINGDSAIVGAILDDDNGIDSGSAYIFCISDDCDEDGVDDDLDLGPKSNTDATVVIDGCDSGVPNTIDADGCSISDLIAEIEANSANHGNFVSGVSHLINELKMDGVISGSEKGDIQSCASHADGP